VRILVDKDRIMSRITLPVGGRAPYQPPTQAQFTNLVNDFWYHAVWTAKKLRRGELWTAIMCCDTYMKNLLARILEWHTHAVSPSNDDTWFNGRFIEEWADADAISQMHEAFAHYTQEDVARALLATMALFRRIATETAAQLTYSYPHQADADVSLWVEATLRDLR
jgi:aminoglycoside 6-adenylyltransferase